MNISIISGSRADYGLLDWPLHCLRKDPFFCIAEVKIWGHTAAQSLYAVTEYLEDAKPDLVLLAGDRYEILSAALAAHLQSIPIAHLCGGDVSEGSYDDAMRDCISRLSTIHFPTSDSSLVRLVEMGCHPAYMVGSTGIDYIINAEWKSERPYPDPYVVVSYQAETIDGTVDLPAVNEAIGERNAIWITPNPDRGNELIIGGETFGHAEFLNLLFHCEEFIGNSSAILYEAPALGIKTRMIGKRQRGRSVPFGDGKATERIITALKAWRHG